MPRRELHEDPYFNDYRVNVVEKSGVYVAPMEKIIALTEYCASQRRWSVLHIRYVLDDGASNNVVIQAYKNRLRASFKYVWVLEKSKQDNGDRHYHAAIFIDRDKRQIGVVTQVLATLKAKSAIKSFRPMPPDESKIPADLRAELDPEELKAAIKKTELALKNVSAVKFAVYWLSYLAKESTKVLSARSFGSSKVPENL